MRIGYCSYNNIALKVQRWRSRLLTFRSIDGLGVTFGSEDFHPASREIKQERRLV